MSAATAIKPMHVDDEQSSEMLAEYLIPLKPFLDDTDLTEICINRPREVWTEGRGGWTRHEVGDLSYNHCTQLATLIASYNGKAISAQAPVLSAALATGERVQVIIAPGCEARTVSITIRKPSLVDKSLDELEADGAFSEAVFLNHSRTMQNTNSVLLPYEQELLELKNQGHVKDFLRKAVIYKRTLLIAGKTGSGKTTLTKTMVHSIPVHERLITIEDVHELKLSKHDNKVHLFYAREDEGGSSKVTPKQALASCLRMKPDRILLAELRGDESWEFIKSANTGHPGSISTMHSNGALESFEQLTALIKDSPTGAHIDASYITHRLHTTLDVIVFMSDRKVREIYYDPEFKRQQLG